MKSFVSYPENSDFSIHNIPFGVAVFDQEYIACATRIGDIVIDLATLYDFGYFNDVNGLQDNVFEAYTLNELIELGKPVTKSIREKIQTLLLEGSSLSKDEKSIEECFFNLDQVKMLMPVHVANYTDFYSSIEHATNVGKLFRDPENALLPNWRHLPVAYHGRASSIVVSGTEIIRPKGQTKAKTEPLPSFGPCKQLDFELELGFIINQNTEMGDRISVEEAEDSIFGLVLFNDWSARDIQSWEYVPLGPFLAKNFASSISPWVVTLEALEPFRTESPKQEPEVLEYLKSSGKKNYDIHLEVGLTPDKGTEVIITKTNFKTMYWNMAQQLAHHTVNGCNVEVGDLYASGTISGNEPDSFGSLLELTYRGEKPLVLNDGQKRKFLEDQDTVSIRGWAEKDGIRVGFGEVVGTILPAK